MNGYPREAVQPILRKRSPNEHEAKTKEATKEEDGDQKAKDKKDQSSRKEGNPDTDNKVQIVCLPYVKGVSEKIEKTCKIVTYNMKVVFKPVGTVRRTLMRVKDQVPAEKREGVIYQIPCKDCKQVYIGETGHILQKHISRSTSKQCSSLTCFLEQPSHCLE